MESISTYPQFDDIDIGLKFSVSDYLAAFEPYSDFNFASLFCWSAVGPAQISKMRGNLLVRIPSYLETDKYVVSILGVNEIDYCVERMMADHCRLDLVPEVTINHLEHPSRYTITEDQDNFDYVYRLEELARLADKKYKSTRRRAEKFISRYGDHVLVRTLDPAIDHYLLEAVFKRWSTEREKAPGETDLELGATLRAAEYHAELDLVTFLIYIDGECCGYSVHEIHSENYATCHFHKSILSFEHIDKYFTKQVAMTLLDLGVTYVNWEQDLGIPGLRALKKGYCPNSYLRKYSIQ